MCLGRILSNPESNEAWEQRLGWIKSSKIFRNFDRVDGEPMEFEWNIFPGFQHVAAQRRSQKFTVQIGRNTGQFHRKNSIYVDVQRHFLWIKKTTIKNVWQMTNSYLCTREDLEKGNGYSLVLVLRKSGIVSKKTVLKEFGTKLQKGCCWNSQKADVQFSALRAHCPEVNSKSKGHGKLSIHYAADLETVETIFRIIVSANQLSLCGAVAEMCEEYESLHDRSRQPDKVMGQSIVLSEIKTEVPLDCDDLANKDLLLQQYRERIEKLSQQDKLSKFCMDAGFLTTVEIGQYFMTKDTGEFSEITDTVACREYTLPREEATSQPKGWIQENT